MKQVTILSLMLLFVAVSCKKGDQGPPGTANVQYSEWFTPNVYIKDTLFGSWGFKFNKAAPGITQAVLDTGAVQVFGKLLGYNPSLWPANLVQQLPITITYRSGGVQNDTWSARITPGNVQIRFVNDQNIYTSIANTHQFRYIVIPGGKPVGGRVAQRSYEELCRELGIPE